jgi:hypothetical protein
MPAIDQCEPQVIRALQKQGWEVTHQPFAVRIDRGRPAYVYADMRLRRIRDQVSLIVVEVKCFAGTRTLLDEFYQAIGQYVVYRHALEMNGVQTPIYLTVPDTVYATFLQGALIEAVLHDIQVKLIVVNLEKEEVVRWRH